MHRNMLGWSLALVCAGLFATAFAGEPRDGMDHPLPHDPAVEEFSLPNGIEVVIKPHGSSPERAHMELVVRAGSLHERDGQQGAAMFISHMTRSGSTHFPKGTVTDVFEEHGIVRPERRMETATYDLTRYEITLTHVDESSLRIGLTYLSDVLGRLELSPDEVERVRGEAIAEHQATQGADQRIRQALLPRLAPGSLFASRPPRGRVDSLLAMSRDDLKDFYDRTYRASNATLLIVGDVSVGAAKRMVRETFGDLPALPAPAKVDPGLVQSAGMKALVAAEREFPFGYVEVVRLTDRWGAPERIGAYRQELVARVARWCAERQLRRAAQLGELDARQSVAYSLDIYGAARFSLMNSIGGVADWRGLVDGLIGAEKRIREHGFSDREIELARRALLAEAEQAAATESSRDLEAVRREISYTLRQGERVLSAKQRLELMQQLLPTISAAEATRTFESMFDVTKSAILLISDDPSQLPSEDELLRYARAMASRPAPAPLVEGSPEAVMASLPAPGSVDEMTIHPDNDVLSAWLSNGVRVHHREMTERANQAIVSITLAGGSIEEDSESRGLTDVAARVFEHPATASLSSADISDLLIGKNIRLQGRRGADFVRLTIEGDPSELETGLQLAHLLLTKPRVEQGELKRWRQEALQRAWLMERQPVSHLQLVASQTLYADQDPRVAPLRPADIEAIDAAPAQAWLSKLVRHAPVEVSIVGDISRSDALDLAKRYLASIPERERIDEATNDELRTVRRAEPPHEADVTLQTETQVATMLIGFLSPDASERRENMALDVAQQVLSKRLRTRVQEEDQLVFTYRLSNKPAEAYPGFGTFCFWAPTAPEHADELADAVGEVFSYFSANGPTPEEVAIAADELRTELMHKRAGLDWWADQLSDTTYRGMTPRDLEREPAMLEELTASDVHQVFQRHFAPENRIRIIVRPETTAEACESTKR